MPASRWYKLTHDIAVISAQSIEDGSFFRAEQKFEGENRANYLFIAVYGKPLVGQSLSGKLQIYQYDELLARWAKAKMVDIPAITDSSKGEAVMVEPILVGPRDIAIALADCEPGGTIRISAYRSGGII